MSFYPVETINGGEKAKATRKKTFWFNFVLAELFSLIKIYKLKDIFLHMITVPTGRGNQIYRDISFLFEKCFSITCLFYETNAHLLTIIS